MNTKRNKKLSVRIICVLIALLLVLPGCGKQPSGKDSFVKQSTEKCELSEADNAFVTKHGIGVEVPSYLLENKSTLTVTEMKTITNKEDGYTVTPVDVKLDGQSSFIGYLTIRIPYDESKLPKGASVSDRIVGMYYNTETEEWERVLSVLDTEKKELVILTDHLSTYGCFYIQNEGSKYAKVIGYDTFVASDVDPLEALEALQEYNSTKKLTGLARLGAGILKAADGTSDYLSYLNNVDAIIRAGDSSSGLPIHQKMFEVFGNVGLVLSVYKVTSCLVTRDGTFEKDVAGTKASVDLACALYAKHLSDIGTFTEGSAASSVASSSFAVSCAAIFVFDKLIDYMFTEAKTMKYEKDEEIYAYFNNSYNGYGYTARTDNDWIRILFDLTQKADGDEDLFINMLNSNIYKYASRFWEVFDEKPDIYNDILVDTGYTRMSEASPEERDALFEKYKGNLLKRLETLQPALQEYYEKKLEQQVLSSMQEAGKVLNSAMKITVHTDDKSLTNLKVSLDNLPEDAVQKDWDLSLNGKKSKTIYSTVLAYLVIGSPKTVSVYDEKGKVVGNGELVQSGDSVYDYDVELKKVSTEDPGKDDAPTVSAHCVSLYEYSHNGEQDKYFPNNFDEYLEYMLKEYGSIVMKTGKYDLCTIDINLSGATCDTLTADKFTVKGDFYRGDDGAGCTFDVHLATDVSRVNKENGYIVHDYTFTGECTKCYQYPNDEHACKLFFKGTYHETTRYFDKNDIDVTPSGDFNHKDETNTSYVFSFILIFDD